MIAAAMLFSSGEDSLESGFRKPFVVCNRVGAGCSSAATTGSPAGVFREQKTRFLPVIKPILSV